MPLSIRMYEYKSILESVNYEWTCEKDFSNIKEKLHQLIDFAKEHAAVSDDIVSFSEMSNLREKVLERCSYEDTTKNKMKKIGLL